MLLKVKERNLSPPPREEPSMPNASKKRIRIIAVQSFIKYVYRIFLMTNSYSLCMFNTYLLRFSV